MLIAFIGNFIPDFSTENERAWSFEKLGHRVIKIQENKTNAAEVLSYIGKVDLLCYSHTHDPNWIINGLRDVFYEYKKSNIPTVSIHLDRWAGLARQSDMGKEATWFTEFIFMADGSPEAVKLYEQMNLNWYWLKPGVVERDCYMAEPDHTRFPHEIVFAGSWGYHPEYPWRHALIRWLKDTYGPRFGHYGNDGLGVMRGADLNTLYASAKIVVGDSCFAGQTKDYWSDRIPETTGRGGFLIHPKVEGCDHKGVVFFQPGSFDELKTRIDTFLLQDDQREERRQEGFEWTKKNRTYTNLSHEMLAVIETVHG